MSKGGSPLGDEEEIELGRWNMKEKRIILTFPSYAILSLRLKKEVKYNRVREGN